MVRMIHHSGCEYDILNELHSYGFCECTSLSDIDRLKKTYHDRFRAKRTEITTTIDTPIRMLIEQRETICQTYTEGFQRVTGWFKCIPITFRIFMQRNRLQRAINSLINQENCLTEFFQHKNEFLIGARGENKVISELEKLPDGYNVIND